MTELDMEKVIVYGLGVSRTYKGFYYVIEATKLVSEQPHLLCALTKELYPAIAKKFGVNVCCVERNVRTVVNICWEECRSTLENVAGRQLLRKPTAGEFIALIATHLRSQEQAKE